ncbi:MAG: GNAT family N-acetyltransferase [Phycisphaeraceae bacterium]
MSSSDAETLKPTFEPVELTLCDGRKVLIRAGVPADALAMLTYMKRCLPDFSPYIAMDPGEFAMTEADEREWLEGNHANPSAINLFAFAGETIVAALNCSCQSERTRVAHIGHLGMSSDKAYWGSGLGSALLSALIDWAERHPVLELLELDVFADNKRAIALYLGSGFVQSGVVPGRGRFMDGSRKDGVMMFRRVDGTLSNQPRPDDFHEDLGGGVVLRQLRYSDAQQLFDLYVCNRERMRPYFRWPMTVKSVGQVRGAIAECVEDFASVKRVNAALECGGELLGLIFMNSNHDPGNHRTELAYWVDAGGEGRGLVTRGCDALIRYAFEQLGMNRIDITVDVTNTRSLAIPERLGFTREAVIRQWIAYPDGRITDMANYRLLREDWKKEVTP